MMTMMDNDDGMDGWGLVLVLLSCGHAKPALLLPDLPAWLACLPLLSTTYLALLSYDLLILRG
jgi:hypothetical protein